MSDDSLYRAPCEGMVLSKTLVPEVSTRRCQWFGHRLMGRYERSPLNDTERRMSEQYNLSHYDQTKFPSSVAPPCDFVFVWCARCGREWRRER